jgi:hypothetical protein
MRHFLLLLLLLAVTPLAAGELYKWVDEDGTVHFSDRKPADGAERVDLEPLNVADPVDTDGTAGAAATDSGGAPAGATVTMYSTSWCGYCKGPSV